MRRFHRPRRWFLLIVLILASAESKGVAAAGSTGPAGDITYLLRWQPSAQGMSARAAIGISLTFTAEGARTTIDFPHRWGLGLRDLHRRISDISVDGSAHAVSLDSPRLELATRPGQRLTVEYRISPRRAHAARSFPEALLPTAGRDHLFLPGEVGLAVPDFFRCTPRSCRKYSVRVRWDVPESWRVASDHGADARDFTVPAIDSRSMLNALFIAGTTFHRRALPGGGVLVFLSPAPVSDAVRDIFDDAAHVAAVVDSRWPAHRGERAIWLDRLAEGRSRTNSAGVQTTSNIALFSSDFERNRGEVLHSFVHEIVHGWIGLQLFAVDERSSPAAYFGWFAEGFTEYFTDVFLFRAGRRSFGDMVETYNETLLALLNQYDPTASLHAMATQRSRRFDRLSYLRGYLLAHELAARLREGGREPLEQRVLRIVREGRKGRLSLPELLGQLAAGDTDIARLLHAVLLEGRPLEVRATALGPCARAVEVSAPVGGPGFDPVRSVQLRRVVGLRTGSAAAKAGLREGDELIEYSLDDSQPWNRSQHRLRVRRNGESKLIAFDPDSGNARSEARVFEVAVDDAADSACGSPWE